MHINHFRGETRRSVWRRGRHSQPWRRLPVDIKRHLHAGYRAYCDQKLRRFERDDRLEELTFPHPRFVENYWFWD